MESCSRQGSDIQVQEKVSVCNIASALCEGVCKRIGYIGIS